MKRISRRDFACLGGAAAACGLTIGFPGVVRGAGRRVVVVGGGVGGCTAARYLRRMDPGVEVTLITAEPRYTACFMSNEVLSGERTLDSLMFGYEGLKKHGVQVLIDRVVGLDPVARKARTASGAILDFDACLVSPGVDFKWNSIDGYDEKASEIAPHAWSAGPQTLALRKQIEAMPDGGKVVIVAPRDPFKCPPGPYERASQIAMYCRHHKPKSKIVILDAKDTFSKQGLFVEGWTKLYGYGTDKSMIEWVSAANGGKVSAFDPTTRTVTTEFDKLQGNVVNIVPAQKAGKIAFEADLVDGDWCPVDKKTFESKRHRGIYVLGDACDAAKMPKSAYAANSQAKVAVAAIVARFKGREPGEASYVNTCYSIVGEEFGISVAGIYYLDAASNMIEPIKDSGGISPANASPEIRKREVSYAHSWLDNVIDDMLGGPA